MKNILILLLLVASFANAQRIRKNYREMTTWEKQTFTDAIKALIADNGSLGFVTFGNSPITGNKQSQFGSVHSEFFFNRGIHGEIRFTSWHRWFIYVYENELRNSNIVGANKITLPYWDWTSQYFNTSPTDREINSPLWDNNFMGQFNNLLNLDRTVGESWWATLPTSKTVSDCLAKTIIENSSDSRNSFRYELETYNHNSAHVWVGGLMGGIASPRDPIFFLHHNMVDKIWQNWTDLGNASPFPADKQDFNGLSTTMKSNDVDDSRKLKVWFAENGKVELNKYTATGIENYDYTGTINVSNNFVVPSGTTANFTSATEIAFLPGTSIEEGSSMSAEINESKFNGQNARMETQETEIELKKNISSEIKIYPNPFKNELYIQYPYTESVEIKVFDVIGKIIYKNQLSVLANQNIFIETTDFQQGIFIINIHSKSFNQTTKIIKQ